MEKSIADENSLYHEVKRLISVRGAHEALAGKGRLKFIYAEKNAYPLAYTREASGEKILVVLNTSAKPADFDCSAKIRREIYSFGGKITAENGKILVQPQSVGFFEI